jgi:hypothetical protein
MDNGQSGIQLIGGLEAKEPTFIPVSGRKTFLTFPSYRSGNYTQGPSPRSRARHLTGYYLLRGKRYTPPERGWELDLDMAGAAKRAGSYFSSLSMVTGTKLLSSSNSENRPGVPRPFTAIPTTRFALSRTGPPEFPLTMVG